MVFAMPLDLEYWYLTTLAGSVSLFIGLLLLAVGFFVAATRIPDKLSIILFTLGVVMLFPIMGEFFLLAIIIIALYVGLVLYKVMQ